MAFSKVKQVVLLLKIISYLFLEITFSFSGAENEPRDIHPLQGLPLYWEDAT